MAKRMWVLLVALAGAAAQEKAPGYLGVRVGTVDAEGKVEGVVILDSMPGTPAAGAGFKPGDVLVQFAGAPVRTPEELIALVRARAPGDEATYVLVRAGGRIEGKLKLAASPPEAPPTPPLDERLDRVQKNIEELQRRLEKRGPRTLRDWLRVEQGKLGEARAKGDREGVRRAEIRIELLREMEAEGVRGLEERVDRIEKKVDRILERLGER
jgi:membrane-associated protease RseP (regulator of RpoE activity)